MAMVSTPSSTPEAPPSAGSWVSAPAVSPAVSSSGAVSPPPQAARDSIMARAISKLSILFIVIYLFQNRFRGEHRPSPPSAAGGGRTKYGPLCQAVHGKYGRTPRRGRLRTAIDSASQRFVTVRQVFPDGPAAGEQASSRRFGGGPFPVRRLPGLAGAVLMNAAPLSERSNFAGILPRSPGDVNARWEKNGRSREDLCTSAKKPLPPVALCGENMVQWPRGGCCAVLWQDPLPACGRNRG